MTRENYNKNWNNAFLARKIKIGNRVMVIRTGETGIVTKIVKYDRDNDKWDSPYGYSTIQVRFDNYDSLPHHKKVRHYSASSLKIIQQLKHVSIVEMR